MQMGKNRRTFAYGKMVCRGVLKKKRQLMQIGMACGAGGIVSLLFYNSPWGLCSIPIFFYLSGHILREKQKKKINRRIELEFKDYMYAVCGALSAGNSVERSFLSGLAEMRQLYGEESVLASALQMMENRLSLQEPIENILSDFAAESGSGDIESFMEIFCYAKRCGGDFIHIMETSAGRICDKIEIMEEIYTVMAEKAIEQKVMCIVPFGILLFFRITSPEFIGKLYGNLFGIAVMTIALLLYGMAFYMGRKIVEVEV